MTYQEYQVWFHAFNNAYTALCRDIAIARTLTLSEIQREAQDVAKIALNKFKDVELPDTPNMSNIDLQGLVNSVAQNAVKGTK
jgi:hypothetical protein